MYFIFFDCNLTPNTRVEVLWTSQPLDSLEEDCSRDPGNRPSIKKQLKDETPEELESIVLNSGLGCTQYPETNV